MRLFKDLRNYILIGFASIAISSCVTYQKPQSPLIEKIQKIQNRYNTNIADLDECIETRDALNEYIGEIGPQIDQDKKTLKDIIKAIKGLERGER